VPAREEIDTTISSAVTMALCEGRAHDQAIEAIRNTVALISFASSDGS
jgi:hypothetical protein